METENLTSLFSNSDFFIDFLFVYPDFEEKIPGGMKKYLMQISNAQIIILKVF
jgi:hypothetical protein